jgi:hypothetical protein
VVFEGRSAQGEWGVYQFNGTDPAPLLVPGDLLGGLQVESAGLPSAEFMGGGSVLIQTNLGLVAGARRRQAAADLEPGSHLYRAVPEPQGPAPLLIALFCVLGLRAKAQRSATPAGADLRST